MDFLRRHQNMAFAIALITVFLLAFMASRPPSNLVERSNLVEDLDNQAIAAIIFLPRAGGGGRFLVVLHGGHRYESWASKEVAPVLIDRILRERPSMKST